LVPPSSPEATQPRTHTRRANLSDKSLVQDARLNAFLRETRPAEAVPQPDGGPGHQALLQ
jgi:hypothetical protein